MKKTFKLASFLMAIVMAFVAFNVTSFADTVLQNIDKAKLNVTLINDTATPYVTLTWDMAKRSTVYYVYRSIKKDSGFKKIAEVKKENGGTFIDKNVTVGKTYYYRVKAFLYNCSELFDTSPYSDKVKITVKEKDIFTATVLSESKIKLNFQKTSNISRIYIYISEDGKNFESIGYTKKNSYTFKNLKTGTKYYFKIRPAKVSNGKIYKEKYSSIVTAVTSIIKSGVFSDSNDKNFYFSWKENYYSDDDIFHVFLTYDITWLLNMPYFSDFCYSDLSLQFNKKIKIIGETDNGFWITQYKNNIYFVFPEACSQNKLSNSMGMIFFENRI